MCGPNWRLHCTSFLHPLHVDSVGKFPRTAISNFAKSLENNSSFKQSIGDEYELELIQLLQFNSSVKLGSDENKTFTISPMFMSSWVVLNILYNNLARLLFIAFIFEL